VLPRAILKGIKKGAAMMPRPFQAQVATAGTPEAGLAARLCVNLAISR
jgi:hypothetical protein